MLRAKRRGWLVLVGILLGVLQLGGAVNASQVIVAIRTPVVSPDTHLAVCGNYVYLVDDSAKAVIVVDIRTASVQTMPPLNRESVPADVASGRNGTCWIAFRHPDVIVAVRAARMLNVYPLPSSNLGIYNLSVAGDGSVWYTLAARNQLGSFVPPNHFQQYNLPAAASSGTGWRETEFLQTPLPSPTPCSTDNCNFNLPTVNALTPGPGNQIYFWESPFMKGAFIAGMRLRSQRLRTVALPTPWLFGLAVLRDGTVIAASNPRISIIRTSGEVTNVMLPRWPDHCVQRNDAQVLSLNKHGDGVYFVVPAQGLLYELQENHGTAKLRNLYAAANCPVTAAMTDDGRLAVLDAAEGMLVLLPLK